jgi:hypothetical protein
MNIVSSTPIPKHTHTLSLSHSHCHCHCLSVRATDIAHALQKILSALRAALASGKQLITEEEIGFIFWNIEEIRNAHRVQLGHLSKLLDVWPCVTGVGELYINFMPVFKLYDEYVVNFKNAQETLKVVKTRPKFNQFLAEITQKIGQPVNLSSYLSQPLSYLGRTHPILEQLCTHCDPNAYELV